MRCTPLLLAVAGILCGAGALAPPDCTLPPLTRPAPGASLDAADATAPGMSLHGVFASGQPALGCEGPALPVNAPVGSLRNEQQDLLHGLQPANQLRSPIDESRNPR